VRRHPNLDERHLHLETVLGDHVGRFHLVEVERLPLVVCEVVTAAIGHGLTVNGSPP
jgi:hypothetical protein